jgi:hypothetical protein
MTTTSPAVESRARRSKQSRSPRTEEAQAVAAITAFLQDHSFDTHDIQAMSMAFEDVCKALNLPQMNHQARKAVAARIIELARRGEINPTRLCDRVLKEAGWPSQSQ